MNAIAGRVVRRRAFSLATVVMLVVCVATGAIATLFDAVDRAQGPLQWLVLSKDAIYVYGFIVASVTTAAVGAGVAHLAPITVTFGGSWRAQHRATWLHGALVGVLAGGAVLTGVVLAGFVQTHSHTWSDDLGRGSAIAVVRALAAYAIVGAFGAGVGLAVRRVAAAAGILLLLQLPALPVAQNLYSRSGTVQRALGLLPFGALRGLVTGNSGTFVGSRLASYTVQGTAFLLVMLVFWLAATWAWSWSFPSAGTAVEVLRRRTVLVPAAALTVAAIIGGLAGQFGVSSVPWRWTPAWRQASADGQNSRQVAAAWAAAVRSGDANKARALIAAGHGPDVPADVAQAVRLAASYAVIPETTMTDPDHVVLVLRFDPKVHSGDLDVDAAQVNIELADTRGVGWRITATDYPALRIQERA